MIRTLGLLLLSVAGALTSQTQENFGIGGEPAGWVDPRLHGGQQFAFTSENYTEPLNVIISGRSDPFILTEYGFKQYTKSIGFSEHCIGLRSGKPRVADLGDGKGRVAEQFLSRQYHFGPIWGTCWESIGGGYRFRGWKQNGTEADTGAWFLTVSREEHSKLTQRVLPDGYNLARDWLVNKAAEGSHWKGKGWKAEVEWVGGLLEPGSEGIQGGIEQDGEVAILTITRI